jgi:subtilisin family serine protease
MKLIHCLNCVRPTRFSFFSLGVCAVLALASPLLAQKSLTAQDSLPDGTAATSALPLSTQQSVQVMVQLKDDPAGITWAAAYKQAQAQLDAQRNYALAHPTLRTSVALLKTPPQQAQISSAQSKQVQSVAQKIDQTQRSLLPSLTGANIGGRVMFRTQMAYNGIAMAVNPAKIAAITAMPGVKAVHPMVPKYLVTAFSDIDFLNTRPAWTTGFFGTHGENIKVADIDTGLDYIHTNFGGSGSPADYSSTNDTSAVPNANYPTPKIPGGVDLVGDAYAATASGMAPSDTPHPDNNPYDCNGHGTATASLITGFGVTSAGFTYSGTYDASNPDMTTLKCAPGFAPAAKLYPVRVFGCAGSTNVVTQAIEWAMTAGTGNPANRMDVINMSLGANEGFADDADDVAATIASSVGILVCSAAGNAGDSYYIHSSPAAASGTLGVAATFNDQAGFIYDSNVTGNTPPAIAGTKFFSIKGSASSPIPGGGITGNVVYAVPNNGSTALTNAAQVSGNICLVDRGVSTFTFKVTQCLNAGATAVIVDNFNNPGADPILMSTAGQPAGVDVMISRTDRDTINTAAGGFDPTTGIPTNPTNVTINNDSGVVAHGGAAPDTIPSYSSRGPRLPDSATKPDIAAPAEVVGVAQPFTGNGIENFNGTSSATPHVAGMMALLRQLHPSWSVQETLALACNTANHDLFTTTGHTTQYGVGRIGAGRIDVGNAAAATVVAYNGSDPNLLGVSFGPVNVPVTGTTTLTKNITVSNKGATNITYNTSVANDPALTGATFTVSPANFTVNAGTSTTITATLTATGSSLKHAREGSVAATQSGNPRQWLTEAGGYVVLTPTDASPVLRVELYAAPRPAAAMHSTISSFVPTAATGTFTINLSGAPVNTGGSLGNGFDIVSLFKAFELQYANPVTYTDRNRIRYAGVTSDYVNRASGAAKAGTNIMFGVEDFGDAATPDFASSDKEIYIDTNLDGIFDFVVFLTNVGTGLENVFVPEIVNLNTNAGALRFFTNGLSAATADTNIYNNSGIVFPIRATDIGLVGASGTGPTLFQYLVVTFDRNGNEVDESPLMTYDLANPGLDTSGGALEPTWFFDLTTTSIPVNWNGTNFQNNGSLGVWLFHTHNGSGLRSDVVTFQKPTVTGFSPSHGPVGTNVTITGANFNAGTTVKFFNNKTATVTVLTSNTLIATVPAGAVTGPIKVSNAAGSSTAPGNFSIP